MLQILRFNRGICKTTCKTEPIPALPQGQVPEAGLCDGNCRSKRLSRLPRVLGEVTGCCSTETRSRARPAHVSELFAGCLRSGLEVGNDVCNIVLRKAKGGHDVAIELRHELDGGGVLLPDHPSGRADEALQPAYAAARGDLFQVGPHDDPVADGMARRAVSIRRVSSPLRCWRSLELKPEKRTPTTRREEKGTLSTLWTSGTSPRIQDSSAIVARGGKKVNANGWALRARWPLPSETICADSLINGSLGGTLRRVDVAGLPSELGVELPHPLDGAHAFACVQMVGERRDVEVDPRKGRSKEMR